MIIENSKTYSLTDVENLFFRPTFCGKAAEEFGVKVLYNMPIPTKVPLFSQNNNILKKFTPGWQGGSSASLSQKEIAMKKLKAEAAYSAEDYFSTIYSMITTSADVNLGDLTGTDLEKAETELFRRSIVESIYGTMWFGDEDGEISSFDSFPGFLRKMIDISNDEESSITLYPERVDADIDVLFGNVWLDANDDLRAMAADGQLAFFVSSDIYDSYHFWLDRQGLTNVVAEAGGTRPTLLFHGIPVVEVPGYKYNRLRAKSFCILTDRRNLILALNTADSPEKEIRMWYNPDEMENRQRVVVLAGTAIADSNLISAFIYDKGVNL